MRIFVEYATGDIELNDISDDFRYYDIIRSAGGIVKSIVLQKTNADSGSSSDWSFNETEFRNIFSKKTKALILNTPHNPTGKVFDIDELTIIADLAKEWNVLVISDEVYEHMVFPPKQHIRINTLPGMWERTITIGSAGKSFSVTGWKLGWSYGHADLIRNLQVVHQSIAGSCSTPLQEALAIAYETEFSRIDTDDCYFNSIKTELVGKRDFIAKSLKEIGFEVTLPEGGFFILADWSKLSEKIDLSSEIDNYKDFRFTKMMTENISLHSIPSSAFYTESNKHMGENFVRFCYFKMNKTLEEANYMLKEWKHKISSL